ncbi:MAG: hypothetical protein AAF203_07185 [Pseudomonadota bacterium]
MKKWIIILSLLGLMVACSSEDNNQAGPQFSNDLDKKGAGGDIKLQGGDHIREGGHYLYCANNPDEFPGNFVFEEVGESRGGLYFVDYVLGLTDYSVEEFIAHNGWNKYQEQLLIDYEAIRLKDVEPGKKADLIKGYRENTLSQYSHLYMVWHRLHSLYHDDSKFASRLKAFSRAEQRVKQTIASISEEALQLTTNDVSLESLTDEAQIEMITENCEPEFYQAAYFEDATQNKTGQTLFFDPFFQEKASPRQKSFRDVHEALRIVVKSESEQIQKLTAYFHTEHFFLASKEDVTEKLKEISSQSESWNRSFVCLESFGDSIAGCVEKAPAELGSEK